MIERYAHLRPDLFPASDLGTIRVDLFAGGAEVVQPQNWIQPPKGPS